MYHQLTIILVFEAKDVITSFYWFCPQTDIAATWKQEIYSRFKMKQLSNFSSVVLTKFELPGTFFWRCLYINIFLGVSNLIY